MEDLHDFGLEVAQGCVGTAVLATGLCIGWPVHIGQERHFLYPQRIDNDMHMNVAAVAVSYTHLDVYKRQVHNDRPDTLLTSALAFPAKGVVRYPPPFMEEERQCQLPLFRHSRHGASLNKNPPISAVTAAIDG